MIRLVSLGGVIHSFIIGAHDKFLSDPCLSLSIHRTWHSSDITHPVFTCVSSSSFLLNYCFSFSVNYSTGKLPETSCGGCCYHSPHWWWHITPAADAISLHKRDAPAVVRLSIERRQIADPAQRDRLRRKRDATVSVGLVKGANLWVCLTISHQQ